LVQTIQQPKFNELMVCRCTMPHLPGRTNRAHQALLRPRVLRPLRERVAGARTHVPHVPLHGAHRHLPVLRQRHHEPSAQCILEASRRVIISGAPSMLATHSSRSSVSRKKDVVKALLCFLYDRGTVRRKEEPAEARSPLQGVESNNEVEVKAALL
jgi:hypothetical protein